MADDTRLNDLLDALEFAKCPNEVWDTLFTFTQSLGVDAMGYHHLPPPGALDFDEKLFLARGYNQDSITQYRRNHNFFKSPFENRKAQLNKPVFWTQAQNRLELSGEQLKHLKAFCFKEHYNGVIIPLFGAYNRNGCVFFHFEDAGRRYSKSEIRNLKWASQAAHQVFSRLHTKTRRQQTSLTTREQEILTWVARGKSNSVIADIVGISQHTVNGHLRRIYLKTGTSDRTTASLRGIGEHLINY